MKKVIVYRKQLLRRTETFIKAQIQSYKKYTPVLYGENYWPEGMELGDIAHAVLVPDSAGRVARIWAKIRQRLGIVPRKVFARLQGEHPEIIHAHTGFDGTIAWPYARKLGVPLVVTLHGQCTTTKKQDFYMGRLGFWNRFYPLLLLNLGRKKHVHFVAVSEATRNTAIAFGLPEARIQTLYSGIRLDDFPESTLPMEARPKRVVFVARLIEFKGCRYLIDAFTKVREATPDAELVIIGDGPLRAELERQAEPQREAIQFWGACGQDEIVRALSSARAFCLPSITTEMGNYETFGMVAIEAQAVGVPVITSARGAKESVVDGVTGFYFAEKDVESLALLIDKIINDSVLAGKMGANAARHVREAFGTEKCNALIEAYYDKILAEPV
jgi:glycosyltransferase involved in cell wall biosynthesis